MSDRLFLNDVEVDLDEDSTKIAVTSQINDLADLQDRQSVRTNQFKLPTTQHNLVVLENIDLIQSTSTIQYKRIKAKYVKDGIEIIPNGFAIIQRASKFIEVTVYSGNFDFFTIIGNKKLKDLNLASLNFLWDFGTYLSLRGNTTGIKSILFDSGDLVNTNRSVNVENQRFAIFIDTLVQQIFIDAGFQVDGEILSDPRYLKTMISILNDEDKSSPFYDTLSRIIFNPWITNPPATGIFPTTSVLINPGETWVFTFKLKYNIPIWYSSGLLKFYSGGGSPLYTHTGTSGTYFVTVTKNYTNTTGLPVTYSSIGEFTAVNVPSVNFLSGTVEGLRIGDVDPAFYIHVPSFTFAGGGFGLTAFLGSDLILKYNGTTVDVPLSLPDWTQKEFLKMVFNVFGIFISADKFENKIYLKQFKEIVRNKNFAVDMSEKIHVDKNEPPTIEFKIGSYAQNNYFTYTQDELDKNISNNVGRGTFFIPDESLEFEKTVVSLPAAGSLNKKLLLDLDVCSSYRLDAATGLIKDKLVPRLLIDDTQNISGAPIDYFDNYGGAVSDSGNVPLCYFYLPKKEFNLSFEENLLELFYKEIIRSLQHAKKVTALFKINSSDFENIDHFIPWYISFLSAFFYVNKVMNWTGKIDILTKVELIKIESDEETIVEEVGNPELIVEPDFDDSAPWTEIGSAGVGVDFGMSLGKVIAIMDTYTDGNAYLTKGFSQDISGLEAGQTYLMKIKTGTISPYFNTTFGPSTPHGKIFVGFSSNFIEISNPVLQSNEYVYAIIPVGITPPDSTFFFRIDILNLLGNAAYSGGETFEIESISLKKL